MEADVQIVVIVQEADLGGFGRELARIRRELVEARGGKRPLPGGLFQRSVDFDLFRDSDGSDHLRRANGLIVESVPARAARSASVRR
jgi:hypothetical protein